MGASKPTVAGMPGTLSSSLTWETVQSLNIGFDLGMLRNRLNINFDYFIRKTLDMVGPASEVASIYGIGMPASNNTDLRTKGWEIAASWRDPNASPTVTLSPSSGRFTNTKSPSSDCA